MWVPRLCLWVSYECVGVTIVPVGELRVCLCYESACSRVTRVLVSRMCLWVSYKCVGVTIVPVGELRVCLCHECACG